MHGRAESNALLTNVRNFEEGIYAITIAKNHNWSRRGRGGHWLGRRRPVVKPKRWKLFFLTVTALYPLTLLIPEVLSIGSSEIGLLPPSGSRNSGSYAGR
jgi:hypothetical protein